MLPEETRANQEKILNREDTKNAGYLPEILQEMEEPMLKKFVHYVTGFSFIPRVDFQIKIEFNFADYAHLDPPQFNESLPYAHTCDRLMKIPGTAYAGSEGGQRATFQTKLTQALGNYQGFTDA